MPLRHLAPPLVKKLGSSSIRASACAFIVTPALGRPRSICRNRFNNRRLSVLWFDSEGAWEDDGRHQHEMPL